MTTERWKILTEVIDALSNHMSESHRKAKERKGPPLPPAPVQYMRGTQAGLNEAVKLVSKMRESGEVRATTRSEP